MRRNIRPMSFFQAELSDNFIRYKKLIELESQLAIRDHAQDQLHHTVHHLKAENQLLKHRLREKEYTEQMMKRTSSKENAWAKANAMLGSQATNDGKTNHSRAVDEQFNKRKANSAHKASPTNQNYTHSIFRNSSLVMPTHNEYQPSSNIQLSKHVYIAKPLQQCNYSSIHNNKQIRPYKSGEISHKRELNLSCQNPNKDSKFPSRVNQFQGKKAKEHFEEGGRRVQTQNMGLNKWNSQQNFDLKSQIDGRLKQYEHKKRKTFLTIVSVSSKQRR